MLVNIYVLIYVLDVIKTHRYSLYQKHRMNLKIDMKIDISRWWVGTLCPTS